jgi:rod shape determining protein RodA
MSDYEIPRARVEVIGRERIVPQHLSAKAPIRHLDFILLLVTLTLSSIGATFVHSATKLRQESLGLDGNHFLKRQLAFLGVSIIVFAIVLLFDYRQLRGLSPLLYGIGVLLLLIVLTPLGHSTAGAQRWINLGFLQIQPSELMKVVLVIALASLYTEGQSESATRRLPVVLVLAAVPTFLIYMQPDLGTLMVLSAVLLVMLLTAGTRVRWMLLLLLSGVIAFILVLNLGLLRDYQIARLTGFLDPHADPRRAGYNAAQSLIAVASGGPMGKGLLKGTQTNLDFVPEQHTDFIFTAIGEERGFVGAVITLGLFAILLWRALRIALLSKDTFGMLLGAGFAGMFAFQVFINVGMTIGIMPITGIPLPFISYGGSSMITSFVAVGFLMNIHMRRFV